MNKFNRFQKLNERVCCEYQVVIRFISRAKHNLSLFYVELPVQPRHTANHEVSGIVHVLPRTAPALEKKAPLFCVSTEIQTVAHLAMPV